MPKKKKTNSRKKTTANKKSDIPASSLPAGFWSQVSAIFLLAFAVLLVIAWFGAGGPVLDWIYRALLTSVGYTTYVLPILFIFIGIEVFRSENNKLPKATKFVSLVIIVLFSGLFGLLKNDQ